MNFTPRIKRTLTGYRYNPYTSGGSRYLGQYHRNLKVTNSSPRKKIHINHSFSCKRSLTPQLKLSSAISDDRIQQELSEGDNKKGAKSSEIVCDSDEDLVIFPRAKQREKEKFFPTKSKSRDVSPLKENVFDISEDEFDKENAISNYSKVNSFYRKENTPKRSSILHDISPSIKNAYSQESHSNVGKTIKDYKFKRIVKENAENEIVNLQPEYPHLIGFPNYGNTCYLNSVLQSLMGVLPFIIDLTHMKDLINLSHKSITRSLSEVISGRQKCKGADVNRALRILKENIERVDEAFAGCKMQDANEFLTQMLDSIKDEINQFIVSDSPSKSVAVIANNDEHDSDAFDHSLFSVSSDDPLAIDDAELSLHPVPQKIATTSTVINPVIENFGFELLETYKCLGCGGLEDRTQEHFALYVNLPKNEGILNIQKSVNAYMREDQRELKCEKCSHNTTTVTTRFTKLPRILIIQLKRYEYNQDQFECIKVSAKVDINMWLYLGNYSANAVDTAAPWTQQSLVVSSNSDAKLTESESNINSISTICLSDKTKVQDNTTVSSSALTDVSEVAIDDLQVIPLNDSYDKEDEEMQMAIKLSLQEYRVCYSTDDTSDETSSEEAFSEDDNHAYKLISVISHFGETTSTGHYVADVLNCQERQWYHYDDDTVAQLQEAVLLAERRQKNAYIYFYADKNLYEELSKKSTAS